MMSWQLRRWLLVGALFVSACQGRTSVLIQVEADPELQSPEFLDELYLHVSGGASAQIHERQFALTTPFPHSYRLFAHPGFEEEEIVITVTGRLGGTDVVRQAVRYTYIRNARGEVTIHLHAACAGVTCDPGVPCTPAGLCEGAEPECRSDAQCVDTIDCTRDTCSAGLCVHQPDDTLCPTGEVCHLMGGCAAPCAGDAECIQRDGVFCNGAETCVSERCMPATAAPCEDSDACTTDTCDEASGSCTNEPRVDACEIGTSRACTSVCNTEGTQTCAPDCAWTACMAPAELCNGADEDCDGQLDEDFDCTQNALGACTTSCGTTGSQMCSDTCVAGSCSPPAEVCNGADDDCNGTCDDAAGAECCRDTTETCTTGCGSTGMRLCGPTCVYGTCQPPAETCNGMDDDCNGQCDETSLCCANTMGACITSCGSMGVQPCDSGCNPGQCMFLPDTCNGVDDDCDGTCDNGVGLECCAGLPASCATSCDPPGAQTGTQACSSACTRQGSCVEPAEDCTNARDDDCDSRADCLDSDCSTSAACMGMCVECTNSTPITAPGGRFSVTLGTDNHRGTCGGDGGSEAYLTFTLTEPLTDVFAATHGAGVDTVLYLRQGTNCCGNEILCNDDADAMPTSVLRATDLPPGTYHLFVDTKAPMTISVSIDVFIEPPGPGGAGDRCANPIFLAPGTTQVRGTAVGFGADYTPTFGAGAADCDIDSMSPTACDRVYYFYLAAPTTVRFNGCVRTNDAARQQFRYDQLVYFRGVCTEPATQTSCIDDASCQGMAGFCNGGATNSDITATIGPGLFYFFADGWCPSANCDLGFGCWCGQYDYVVSGL